MCGIDFFLNFRSVLVRFWKKTRIRFGMSLVWLGSKNAVWFGYYSDLLCPYSFNSWGVHWQQILYSDSNCIRSIARFHSTFSYPLHSTLLSAAVNHVDVSSVLQTVAEADAARHDLERTVSSSKSSLTQNVRDVEHRDCATHDTRNDDFLFYHVATSEADHVRTKSSRQNLNPMMSRFSCYSEFYYVGKIPRIGIGRPSLQRGVVLKWLYSPRAVGTPLSEVHALYRMPF